MKRVHLLTAIRNESGLLGTFLDELHDTLQKADLLKICQLTIVDDYSTDNSTERIESWNQSHSDLDIKIIRLNTNLGNQGALAFGLRSLEVGNEDVVLTLDSDGEDDISKVPNLIAMSLDNPDKVIYTERGRRFEKNFVPILYYAFRAIMKFFTRQSLLPNNFMLLPGKHVPAVRASAFNSVYYSLSILRLNLPHMHVIYDRRMRYGGQSSQNLFNLVTHGFVGLLVFHETVIARIFIILLCSSTFFMLTSGFALFVKFVRDQALPGWTALFFTINFGFILFILAMLGVLASISMIFKLLSYNLAQTREKSNS